MIRSLRAHWPEYLMEAAGLGAFMVSACVVVALLEHPASPVHLLLPDATLRRVLIGLAMGATAIAIIYSPWGRRSGAHINPAVTLTFLRLGRIARADAFFYVCAQFAGGAAGVALSRLVLGPALAHPAVDWVVTVPSPAAGALGAAAAEGLISFVIMLTILFVGGSARGAPYTGLCAGTLVATYIAVEAPISGMSMNPARTTASAVFAGEWTAFWVYLTVPPVAMLLAAQAYLATSGASRAACAKLHHASDVRCIFCGFSPQAEPTTPLSRRTSMNALDVLLNRALATGKKLDSTALLIARLTLGVLFVSTGWGKVHNLAKVTQFFTELHIPAPAFNATLASFTELICGALLVVGLASRLAALPLVVTMIVALLTAKLDEIHGLPDLFGEVEWTYIALLLVVATAGPGKASLDALVAPRLRAAVDQPPRLPVPLRRAV
jgi:aquaporin Z